MSKQAREKRDRYRREGRQEVKYTWPGGHPPKNIPGQSGRSVLIINSGIHEVTAKVVGQRDSNRYTLRLADYHMRKHHISEVHYGVYFFKSKRSMLRWLLTWHQMGDWKPKLKDFKIEWV